MMKCEAPPLAPIHVPSCVRWAEHDPLFPFSWTDRLGATFSGLDLALFPGVGDTFRIARIPTAPLPKSPHFSNASAGTDRRQCSSRVGPPDATKTGGPVSRH
jgi:hypothetical protein